MKRVIERYKGRVGALPAQKLPLVQISITHDDVKPGNEKLPLLRAMERAFPNMGVMFLGKHVYIDGRGFTLPPGVIENQNRPLRFKFDMHGAAIRRNSMEHEKMLLFPPS